MPAVLSCLYILVSERPRLRAGQGRVTRGAARSTIEVCIRYLQSLTAGQYRDTVNRNLIHIPIFLFPISDSARPSCSVHTHRRASGDPLLRAILSYSLGWRWASPSPAPAVFERGSRYSRAVSGQPTPVLCTEYVPCRPHTRSWHRRQYLPLLGSPPPLRGIPNQSVQTRIFAFARRPGRSTASLTSLLARSAPPYSPGVDVPDCT